LGPGCLSDIRVSIFFRVKGKFLLVPERELRFEVFLLLDLMLSFAEIIKLQTNTLQNFPGENFSQDFLDIFSGGPCFVLFSAVRSFYRRITFDLFSFVDRSKPGPSFNDSVLIQ
jgi:hypothetical protein